MRARGWNRVAWPEGMFLLPQHLQQQDAGVEARVAYHMRLSNPFHWGLVELVLDEQALSGGTISIQHLCLVWQDGTIVRCPDRASIEMRKFDKALDFLTIYVGLKRESDAEASFTDVTQRERHVRYWIREQETADQGEPSERAPVPFLWPNVRVFLSGEEPELDDYDVIKLAEVEATGRSAQPYRIRASYAPPLLQLQAWPALHQHVESIVQRMLGKLRLVVSRRDALVMADLPRILLGYTLGRLAPVLDHLLSSGHAIPFQVYTVLLEVASSLLALEPDPAGELRFPRYDHEDPFGCFTALLDMIDATLDRELADRAHEIPLEYSARHRAYAAFDLQSELLRPENSFYLAVRTDLETSELVRLVTHEAKLGAVSHVEFMVKLAVRGASLEHLPAAPIDVGPKPGFAFFRIDSRTASGAIWKRVLEERSLGLALGAYQEANVRLFIVAGEG